MEREEHHHRPDAQNQCDARWINTVSFVSIFWYNLNGFLIVENVRQFNFFPAKKAPDDSRGVVSTVRRTRG